MFHLQMKWSSLVILGWHRQVWRSAIFSLLMVVPQWALESVSIGILFFLVRTLYCTRNITIPSFTFGFCYFFYLSWSFHLKYVIDGLLICDSCEFWSWLAMRPYFHSLYLSAGFFFNRCMLILQAYWGLYLTWIFLSFNVSQG